MDEIQFFGAIDRKGKDGTKAVVSEWPAWYHDAHIAELENSIREKEMYLEKGMVLPESVPKYRATLEKEKKKRDEIIHSRPKLTSKQKDALNDLYKDLGGKIRDSMFTVTEMKKGWARPEEEARRMSKPIIDAKQHAKILSSMNIPVNRISRDQATKAWKLAGRLLGESTNVERLRRDNAHGVYHNEPRLEDM